jgi:hypothetical protein
MSRRSAISREERRPWAWSSMRAERRRSDFIFVLGNCSRGQNLFSIMTEDVIYAFLV